jgi:HK97 family phage prohead protease
MSVPNRKLETATFSIELRDVGGDGRTLTGLIVPYGETTTDSPYQGGERFLPGSFRKAVQEFRSRKQQTKRPLHLFRAHDHNRAIGLGTQLEETPEGLVGEFRLGRTPYADEALLEYREGLLGAMSVGFQAIQDRRGTDGAREITEASILEASLLPMGAYPGAKVLSLRGPALEQQTPPDLSWITLPPAPKVDPSRSIRITR